MRVQSRFWNHIATGRCQSQNSRGGEGWPEAGGFLPKENWLGMGEWGRGHLGCQIGRVLPPPSGHQREETLFGLESPALGMGCHLPPPHEAAQWALHLSIAARGRRHRVCFLTWSFCEPHLEEELKASVFPLPTPFFVTRMILAFIEHLRRAWNCTFLSIPEPDRILRIREVAPMCNGEGAGLGIGSAASWRCDCGHDSGL